MKPDITTGDDDRDDLDLTVQVISFIIPCVLTTLGIALLTYYLYGDLI